MDRADGCLDAVAPKSTIPWMWRALKFVVAAFACLVGALALFVWSFGGDNKWWGYEIRISAPAAEVWETCRNTLRHHGIDAPPFVARTRRGTANIEIDGEPVAI